MIAGSTPNAELGTLGHEYRGNVYRSWGYKWKMVVFWSLYAREALGYEAGKMLVYT